MTGPDLKRHARGVTLGGQQLGDMIELGFGLGVKLPGGSIGIDSIEIGIDKRTFSFLVESHQLPAMLLKSARVYNVYALFGWHG